MTVAELIAELQKYPPGAGVFTHGYEGGLLPMNRARLALVSVNGHEGWYYGSHDEAEDGATALILEHDGERANSG